MVFGSIAQYAKNLFDTSKILEKIRAYGDISGETGEYFCNPENVAVEKRMYREEVFNFNTGLDFYKNTHPGASEKEVADFMLKATQNSDINEMAKCLAETHRVDPDSVAKFSPELQELYHNNLEALYMIAPDLADHADVPFTGDAIATLVLSGSVLGAMYGIAKLRGKLGSLFHNY